MAAPWVLPTLKKYGIRFNDFKSMGLANRCAEETAIEAIAAG
jgi:hypothetical protein